MRYCAITDRGAVRKQNQDAVFAEFDESAGRGLLLVCDGMGGARAGNVASELTSRVFSQEFLKLVSGKSDPAEIREDMKAALRTANSAVFELAKAEPDCYGMGTTLVAAYVTGDTAEIINVGDSRAYLLGHGTISQITQDHSVVEDMVRRGEITREESRTHPRKNLITRAVGTQPDVKADMFKTALHPGDILLLCSDGLSNVLTDDEIRAETDASDGVEDAGGRLLDKTLQRGAPDNVSVVILGL